VRRIVKPGLVLIAMRVAVSVVVRMLVAVLVRMGVITFMSVVMLIVAVVRRM